MGAFYGSILIRTKNPETVRSALEQTAKKTDSRFLMGPAINGWISIFPNHAGQDDRISAEIANHLSDDILHLQVHDDDVFAYSFYRDRRLIDQYNSCPDYFQEVSADERQKYKGRPDLFQDLFPKPGILEKLKAILDADKEKYVFEQERMREFVEALEIPNALSSYEYLDSGERDEIKGWKQFIHIPDLSAEKAAKKEAQAKVKAQKKSLQKEGMLLAEIRPATWPNSNTWGTESLASKGFVFTPVRQTDLKIDGLEGARGVAVHPSAKFAVANLQGALAVIDLEKQQLLKKLAVNRRIETIDPFARDASGVLAHACLKEFLKNPQVRKKLGVDAESHAAIVQDPKAVEKLPTEVQQKIKALLEKVRKNMRRTMETQDQVFDVRFHPNGEQLFIASAGMRVFDWNKLLSADNDTPQPEYSVDAPIADESDPNSRPLAYCVRFDSERNLLLSSCLAGVIQYLEVKRGRSGTLLRLPDAVMVWRLELTDDRTALCCFCGTRPTRENIQKQRENFLQVWNYPALCKAAGLP